MKPKKNPQKDLNKNQGLCFILGLTLIMLLVYVALEWKTYDRDIYLNSMNEPDTSMDEVIPPLMQLKIILPPPPAMANEIEIIKEDDLREETLIAVTEPSPDQIIPVDSIIVAEIDEEPIIPFAVIEEVPVFPGCENDPDKRECFRKMIGNHIAKNFRYPEAQQEMGIQGKVFVVFVIQKDGSVGQIQLRGPDKGLEAEAARIISKLPKMTPGKQRGTPVKVPFSIPITFALQ